MSSPRTWGCFCGNPRNRRIRWVFPTHVGVFPSFRTIGSASFGLPHARGGVSIVFSAPSITVESSPRTWGCFLGIHARLLVKGVFPTHVGVFLRPHRGAWRWGCLPHARGGVSTGKEFSRSALTVFPTHVGVFPTITCWPLQLGRLPHARGGVSATKKDDNSGSGSSPRTWGCFL